MKHLRVFHSVFQLDPGGLKKLYLVERGAFFERLLTYTYIDIVSVRSGCRCTTYEKEPQVSKVVNQAQVSSSSVLPLTPPVHSSSYAKASESSNSFPDAMPKTGLDGWY